MENRLFWTIIIVGFVALIALSSSNNPDLSALETYQHTVRSGETLWSIAKQYKPQEISMHPYVYELRQINQLENLIIYPGDDLIVLR